MDTAWRPGFGRPLVGCTGQQTCNMTTRVRPIKPLFIAIIIMIITSTRKAMLIIL
jgi:hypothetical protein